MTITTLSPEFLEIVAAKPNSAQEAELEDIVFQAYNGDMDSQDLKTVIEALWYAFVRRENYMETAK